MGPMGAPWIQQSGLPRMHGLELLLLGGFNHLEKYESQWEGLSMIIPYIVEKCLKPPTRL